MSKESSYNLSLISQITGLGFPEEFAVLVSGQLHSERAQRRMLGYLRLAKPRRAEDIVDEMLAIVEEGHAWADKKAAEYYNARYNAFLNSRPFEREGNTEDPNQ
jgi:hypothetical protein